MNDLLAIQGVLGGSKRYAIVQGDCLEVMRQIPSDSLDSIVDDPPSSIGFMGCEWDTDKGSPFKWVRWMTRINREAYRALKPGGYIVVWSLPRTSDLTGMALRLAGFQLVDSIDHVFGQGFPKSKDASKAIDEYFFKLWAKREIWPDALMKRARQLWGEKYKDRAKQRTRLMRRLTRQLYLRAGLAREIVGTYQVSGNAATPIADKGGTYGVGVANTEGEILYRTRGATAEARRFDGYQTALKPAKETWWIARKPFGSSKVGNKTKKHSLAEQLLATGTGAMNVDACRVSTNWDEPDRPESWKRSGHTANAEADKIAAPPGQGIQLHEGGRWTANFIGTHAPECRCLGYRDTRGPSINRFTDGAHPFGDAKGEAFETIEGVPEAQLVYECAPWCPIRVLDEQSGQSASTVVTPSDESREFGITDFHLNGGSTEPRGYRDNGGASRFFNTFEWQLELDNPFIYLAKPSTLERELGCEKLPKKSAGKMTGDREENSAALDCPRTGAGRGGGRHNWHPTLKSIALMTFLIKLVTPVGGVTLSRFLGSGTDVCAGVLAGYRCIGIERDPDFVTIAKARAAYWVKRGKPQLPRPKRLHVDESQTSIFDRIASVSTDAPADPLSIAATG